MSRRLIALLAPALLSLAACAPATRVVLLPQEGLPTAAVTVQARQGQVVLAQPYAVAEVASSGSVDTAQLGRAYELLADSADWAGDDAVNEVLAGNQQLQWLLNYLLDTGEQSEPVPPYDDEADGWARLEKGLTARFTTKL